MKILSFNKNLLLSMFFVTLISGCTLIAGTAAVITSVDVIRDRRTVGSYIDDQLIESKAKLQLVTDKQLKGQSHFNITSVNGIVLLTGETPMAGQRTLAVNLVSDIAQVRQVINEVRMAGRSSLTSRTNDTLLTSKVKVKLFDSGNFDATRIKVVTEYGIVYLMGLVTQIEGDHSAHAARRVSGVQRVVKVFEYID